MISLLFSSTCFEHCCAHHQEVKLYYTASGIVTLCSWPSGAREQLTNLMHKFSFFGKFIIFIYMFRALCAHHQEVKLYYTASGIVTLCRWLSGAREQLTNLMHKFLFYDKFIIFLYIFRAQECRLTCAPDGHVQSVTIPDAV